MHKTLEVLSACQNIKVLCIWEDTKGKYAPMPLFELQEESVEEWNRKAEEQRRKHG